MKPRSILLATLLVSTPACDGDSKVDACVMAFNQTLQCHNSVVLESCLAICGEMQDICVAHDPAADYWGCGDARSYCTNKCATGFRPDDPTQGGAYPNRTDFHYYLESCTTPDEQQMICSDLTSP